MFPRCVIHGAARSCKHKQFSHKMFNWYLQKVQSAWFQLLLCLVGAERIQHPLFLASKISTAIEKVLNKNNFEPHTSCCQDLEMYMRWPHGSCKLELICLTSNSKRPIPHTPKLKRLHFIHSASSTFT